MSCESKFLYDVRFYADKDTYVWLNEKVDAIKKKEGPFTKYNKSIFLRELIRQAMVLDKPNI